jgi:hypothetical protein
MRRFLELYVEHGDDEVRRVLVQMLRHSLMHTGALRFLAGEGIAYTWRIQFGHSMPSHVEHFSISEVDRDHPP